MKRNITRLIYTIIVGVFTGLVGSLYNLHLTSIIVGVICTYLLVLGLEIIDNTTITIEKEDNLNE